MPWRWLHGWLPPTFDWIQVEVTSHCSAACTYCPRTVFRDSWNDRHMSMETFGQLVPAFARTRLVFLQGWGEPLLHPRFFEMAVQAKEAGARVGVSISGMLLDRESAAELVHAGVDIVAFSLAGTGEGNDAVRQVVISTLDFVPRRDLVAETLRPECSEEYTELRSQLDQVVSAGAELGIETHAQLFRPGERRLVCTENVRKALFRSADGSVSPCVFTNLPVSHATVFVDGVERPYEPLVLGNVNESPLDALWRSKDYARFRESFHSRDVARLCRGCAKLGLR
jgi:MoaA/NifB/PqqE/SkfB family radical SAM enzyme